MLPCSPRAPHARNARGCGAHRIRPQRTEPLCKYKVHPSHPGRGVAGKAGDLGTPKLHADTPPPMPNPPSLADNPPPRFLREVRGQVPASRVWGYLSSCSQHFGRWHRQPRLEPGIRECGKRLAGGPGTEKLQHPRPGGERTTRKGWKDGWVKRMERSQQLVIAATPACPHKSLPEHLHPCHELGRAQQHSLPSRFPPRPPLEPPDNPSSSCQVPAVPSPAPVGRMKPAASKANLPALLLSCCKTLSL